MWFEKFMGSGQFADLSAKLNRNFDRIEAALSEYGVSMTTMGPHKRRVLTRAGSGVFSGTAYAPNGHPTTGLSSDSTKQWVKFKKGTFAFTQEVGPPSDPCPADEYWFRKSGVAGDIRMFM